MEEKVRVIIRIYKKSKIKEMEQTVKEFEDQLNYGLSIGYKIKNSNIATDSNYDILYALMEKED